MVLAAFTVILAGRAVGDHADLEWERLIEEPLLHHVVATQEIVWPLTGDGIFRSLEMWFVPPNRFKACYGAPDSQVVVADGTRVWTYAPENRQVLVQEQREDLTWRESPLGHMLRVGPAAVSVDSTRQGRLGRLLTWIDTEGTGQFVRVDVFVSDGMAWPEWASLVDIGGNVTTYALLRWDRTSVPADADRIFVVDIPDGVEVVTVD